MKEKMSISCYILLLLLLCSSKIVCSHIGWTGETCKQDKNCYSNRCNKKSKECECGRDVGNPCLENTDCCGDANLCMHLEGMKFNCCLDLSRKLFIEEARKASTQSNCYKYLANCAYDCQCCSGYCDGDSCD